MTDPDREQARFLTELQDVLLPASLPVTPALDLSATYLQAPDARAGGDWFDAIVRSDGTVALVVGDTVGQGIAAAAAMGQLRAILHERLLAGDSISRALRSLDGFARLHPESCTATMCVVVVDPTTGSFEYCTAGHPAPLVVAVDGSSRFLEPSGTGPLTTESDYVTATDLLGPDDLILLYTDGLIERPGVPPSASTVDLGQVAGWAARHVDDPTGSNRRSARVCEQTLETLTRSSGYSDDITLLAAQRTPPFPAFRSAIDRRPYAARQAREELGAWLGSLQIAYLDEFTVLHAVGELITNAVEHAYPGPARPSDLIEIEATLEPSGFLAGVVCDHGAWNDETPHPDRGRGLGMVSGLVDELAVDHTGSGTVVRFRKRVTRTARLLTGSQGAAVPASESDMAPVPFSTAVEGTRMTVRGPVDVRTADNFRAALRRFSRGGTAELTVDLSAVTHLGSAGVQALHEVHALDGAGLHLCASTGSVAQHVLEVVRLPYDASG